MKYKQYELPYNGKLYYVKNKFNESTMLEVYFDCGSRFDTIAGLAHFTEHMFFTGTDKLSKEEITKKYYDFIGTNAYTRVRNIAFMGHIFSNELEGYLATVSDMINNSTFSQEAVDKEIPIVQQEIARRKDKHDIAADYLNDYNLYGLKTFKDTVLGNQKSVASIKSKHVKDYVNKYFTANNLEVFISTPMSVKKVKRLIIKHLSLKLPVDKNFVKQPFNYEKLNETNFYSVETQNIGKNYLYLNFGINKSLWDFEFKNKFRLVLDMINENSRGMMKYLRLQKSLTYSAYMYPDYCEKNGCITFRTECDKENVNEIIKTLAEYLKNVYNNGFTKEEIEKAKRYYEYKEMTKEEYLKKHFYKLFDYKTYNKVIDDDEIKKVIKETTLDECNNIFKEVFKDVKVGLTLYGNAEEKDVLTKQQLKQIFKMK